MSKNGESIKVDNRELMLLILDTLESGLSSVIATAAQLEAVNKEDPALVGLTNIITKTQNAIAYINSRTPETFDLEQFCTTHGAVSREWVGEQLTKLAKRAKILYGIFQLIERLGFTTNTRVQIVNTMPQHLKQVK
jgi:hypothetical protein